MGADDADKAAGDAAAALGALEAALEAGDWPRSLALALEAWRATRDPALAELIDRLGARCPWPVPPLAPAELARWWIERAVEPYDPVVASALLDRIALRLRSLDVTWDEVNARWGDHPALCALEPQRGYAAMNWVDRLAAILSWPDDPRVAAVLTGWLIGRYQIGLRHTEEVYPIIADRLVELADARALPRLAAFLDDPVLVAGWQRVQRTIVADARERLERAVGALPAPGPEPAALLAALPPSDLERLWQQVGARPDELASRAVLGDALCAHHESRGELFQLQLSMEVAPAANPARDPRLRRARRLLEHERERWFGELGELLAWDGCELRAGMLEVICAGHHFTPRAAWFAARGHRELAAVHTLRPQIVPDGHEVAYAAFVAALPSLRTLVVRSTGTALALATQGARLPIRRLEYRAGPSRRGVAPAAVADDVDALHRLAVVAPAVARIALDPAVFGDRAGEVARSLPAVFPALAKVEVEVEPSTPHGASPTA